MKKNGYINGILMWFDNTFDHGKTPIVLDTSPYKKSTHWKQGLFQFKERLALRGGDVLNGKIYYKKNDDNHRNIDVRIDYSLENSFGSVKQTEYYMFQ